MKEQNNMDFNTLMWIAGILVLLLVILPLIVNSFLRNVQAGTIRMVSWLRGSTVIYRGPGKALEVPLLTTGTTLSSKAINIDLDITDQTADVDASGIPRPIKVQVLASAIVSVGDSDSMIRTAANRFFSKPDGEQVSILTDLLSSSGRRAINLLTHDQLFSAKTEPLAAEVMRTAGGPQALPGGQSDQLAVQQNSTQQNTVQQSGTELVPMPSVPVPSAAPAVKAAEDDDDPLAIIIRRACSRELFDLGLIFNSLNIKVVQSEVADARRRQSAAEANANAEIVSTQQARRSREAQLEAERAISDKSRELAQTQARNAALIAEAEALKQEALGGQRTAELRATQLAQATADAERVTIAAKASADAEAIRITTVASANAQSIRQVNSAIQEGGEAYLRYRQIEMLPTLVPEIAQALANARMITISGDENGGAAGQTASQIGEVLKTVLTLQAVGTLNQAGNQGAQALNTDLLLDEPGRKEPVTSGSRKG
jgi:flotillin